MVLNITKYISEQVKSVNNYIGTFAVNVIKNKDGKIVNYVGEEKRDFSPSDIVGIGGYLRIDPKVSYSKSDKKGSSCGSEWTGKLQFKIAVFSINQNKNMDPFKVENKLHGTVLGISFNSYTGKETDILIEPVSSVCDFEQNLKDELNMTGETGAKGQMVVNTYNLIWTFRKDDNCVENCDVFEEDLCQTI
jgi:hypothetical protein